MRSRLVSNSVFLVATILLESVSSGQAAAPSPLRGKVLDPSRAPIAGAQVTLIPDSGGTTSGISSQSGEFSVSIAPGTYTMKISKEGFLEVSTAVTLPLSDPGGELGEIVLQIVPVFQSLTVIGDDPYIIESTGSATKTPTPLRDIPQSITVVTRELMRDQMMSNIGDVVRYVPGVASHQGENNRDQLVIRGNSTSADFFVNGVRDDVPGVPAHGTPQYRVMRALEAEPPRVAERGGAPRGLDDVREHDRRGPTLFQHLRRW